MAEERFISTCDLSSYSSSFSISSPDSTASSAFSNNITDSGNSSWGFSPPPMPDGNDGPLFHMKFLRASLPSRKRGLSNYFTGKSQSFTSLANVKCVEDLAKPEKKLKSSHSLESVMKSSYNNQTIRSSILSAGSAESMEMPRKASFGRKMSKKNSGLISCRLLLSSPKQMT
uniref:Uncharacterized protein n=1 Tax=Picea sitchensis TaxID=3332 RepID=D5ABC1_PICSI|nr:unknown [Picea sitchensis]